MENYVDIIKNQAEWGSVYTSARVKRKQKKARQEKERVRERILINLLTKQLEIIKC
jgi:hypothetical protein